MKAIRDRLSTVTACVILCTLTAAYITSAIPAPQAASVLMVIGMGVIALLS